MNTAQLMWKGLLINKKQDLKKEECCGLDEAFKQFSSSKNQKLMVQTFYSVLWCHTVRAVSIKTSASVQNPQLRPSLCPSQGGS